MGGVPGLVRLERASRRMKGNRILIYGNSGSGKTTMARDVAASLSVPCLDLDSITWDEALVRKSMTATLALLEAFVAKNPDWVIEGCYGDVIAAAAPHCSELRFLNPGVEACVENCLRRPWESSKFPSKKAQDDMLAALIEWVRRYETRDDEYGLARHAEVFRAFAGAKREYGPGPRT
jgi:adenylate kinase family enzyme